jgi:hypothetical protein
MLSHGQRWKFAFRAFFSLIVHGRLAPDILDAFRPVAAPQPEPTLRVPDPADRATQILALLQRDGRLIDFLMEDLAAYADAQIGAAVRDVHAGCRQALSRYTSLAPVLEDEEGGTILIDGGTDPARVKVVGHATGSSFRGVVRHRGWEVTRLDLPPLPASGRTIVAPAEVEIA